MTTQNDKIIGMKTQNMEKILLEAGEKFGTPLYLYNVKTIEERLKVVRETLGEIEHRIFFAFKANSNLHLLRRLKKMGLGADVVSFFEYRMALEAGFSPSEIIVNGSGKSTEELEFYARQRVKCVNVDSAQEILRMPKKNLNIALRINPNVDAKTHPHISTGLKENKFGIDLKTASDVLKHLPKNSRLVGLHCHIGSQITSVSPFVEALNSLLEFVKKENLELEFLNVGGGWGIDYLHEEKGLNLDEYKKKVVKVLQKFGIPIYLELGRYLIAQSGYLVTKVLEVKKTPSKLFIVVDASQSTFMRPSLYGAHHEIEFFSKGKLVKADVVGRVCESGDTLAKDRLINEPRVGDLAVIYDVGAYGYSMSSNYNLFPRPAEIAYENGEFRVLRKRETFEDMLKHF